MKSLRPVLLGLLSICCGTALGVGMGWAKYGTSTSADSFTEMQEDPKEQALVGTSIGAGQPRAVVDQAEFNFGAVEYDATVRHSFRITNQGTGKLTLKKGATSCQRCTIAELAKDALEPNESIDVAIEYHASSTLPEFRQTATLLTNDPNQPRLELTVAGKIRTIYVLQPSELVASQVSVHDSQTIEARLMSALASDLTITHHEFSDATTADHFALETQPLPADELKQEEAKSGWRLRITIKPGLPLGLVRQKLLLTTNLAKHEKIELPISAAIASYISIAGEGWDEERNMLDLGSVPAAIGAKRKLLVLVRGAHRNEVEMKVGTVTPELMKVSLGPSSALTGGAVVQRTLTIEIPPNSPPANHLGSQLGKLGKISLTTTHPDAKQVDIFVRFAVDR